MQAGITTTLNSRCSVLAAANSVFGRWDDTKGDAVSLCAHKVFDWPKVMRLTLLLPQNIDFMPTILSRFDMIFIVKDEHSMQKDMVGCRERLLQLKGNVLSNRFSPPISSPSPPSPAPGQACPPSPPQCYADTRGRLCGRRAEPTSSQKVHCVLQKVGKTQISHCTCTL